MEDIVKSKIEERNKKFYTEEGIKALRNKLSSFCELYSMLEFNKVGFPFNANCLGFSKFTANSLDEVKGRILELAEMTGSEVIKVTEKQVLTNGDSITKEIYRVK